MIRKIKLLRNIGTFDSDNAAATVDFKRLVLVYGENGRGKTTLTAALRSLSTGNPLPVAERQRLGSQHTPHIILECEGTHPNVIFENGGWNRTLPNLKVFDDVFVDENVYSGLDVDSQHRQNLHELILGEQGVALHHRRQELVSRITKHNKTLDEKSKEIPEQKRYGFSVDDYCALTELPDVEKEISIVKRDLTAAHNQDAIKTTPLFDEIELPNFDIVEIKGVLRKDLPELEKNAEARVKTHLQALGEDAESWVADGMRRVTEGDLAACPFCGQDIAGLELISHYRAYFSEAYAQLKGDIARKIKSIECAHAGGAQLGLERTIGKIRQSEQFWATYTDLPSIRIDTESIVSCWNVARERVLEILVAKQSAPLERSELTERALTALNSYEGHRQTILALNAKMAVANNAIKGIQQKAETANIHAIDNKLKKLLATQARHSEGVASLCDEYLRENEAKACTEKKRAKATEALDGYRLRVFPELQVGVNKYLQRFNAGFRIGNLAPVNIGGGSGSTCAYNVVINETDVAVKNTKNTPGVASFRNTMSSGDRNTLALALFFSTLDQSPNPADAIVIIDDPMSSLDEHRSLTTVQEVGKLSERAGQVIVLSHNKRFLCELWEGKQSGDCASLEIAQTGDESTIIPWDVTQDAITEHDKRHKLLKDFADTGSNPDREIAQAIRLHLEGYLRVACPVQFPPGSMLGPFISTCRQKLGGVDEVLNETALVELREIGEYAKRFHHVTNSAWQIETINSTELRRFVERTLTFAGPPQL